MRFQSATQIPGELARASQVVKILAKYELAAWLKGTEWEPARRVLTSHAGEILTDQTLPASIRMAMTDLGTTFTKLGQFLGTRPDLVGPEVAHELSRLQEGAPADPPDVAVATVEKELARPLAECFLEFEPAPMASASIGQVHRAKLLNGRPVVVKVQHSGIEGTIRRDLDILSSLAAIAERQDELKRYQPVAVVREFRQTLMRELDFRREMRSLQQFRQNFADDQTVVFPKPYPDLSTGRVLTMQLLKGTSVGDTEKLHHTHVDGESLARHGAGIFVQMIFRDGFYHADPHPGNILVMPKGQLGILDGGMVGRIDDELRERMVEILLAAADRDAPRLADIIAETCKAPVNLDRGGLSADLMEVFGQFSTQAVGQFDVSGALGAVIRILHEYNLVMPSRLSMLIKCLIVLEGTAKGLNPSFNLAELLEPFRRQFVLQQYSPTTWLRKAKRLRRDWALLAESIPHGIKNLLDQLQSGDFSVHIKHPPLETSVNRMVYGMCTSALLIASALLWIHEVPPTIHGVSILGAAGYLIAAFLATRILWIISRSERGKED
ncbi:MAG TPA: AarF/UbiB family protein [Phycisphaerae bacterium]|nr:AarF/UbiB family protein [Phycisphaerae bacterium]